MFLPIVKNKVNELENDMRLVLKETQILRESDKTSKEEVSRQILQNSMLSQTNLQLSEQIQKYDRLAFGKLTKKDSMRSSNRSKSKVKV